MHTLRHLTLLFALTTPCWPVHTLHASCGFIKDSDERSLCRAIEQKNSGQCGFIKDSDKRAYCRAVTGSGSGQCGFIKDSDLKSRCRTEAR